MPRRTSDFSINSQWCTTFIMSNTTPITLLQLTSVYLESRHPLKTKYNTLESHTDTCQQIVTKLGLTFFFIT